MACGADWKLISSPQTDCEVFSFSTWSQVVLVTLSLFSSPPSSLSRQAESRLECPGCNLTTIVVLYWFSPTEESTSISPEVVNDLVVVVVAEADLEAAEAAAEDDLEEEQLTVDCLAAELFTAVEDEDEDVFLADVDNLVAVDLLETAVALTAVALTAAASVIALLLVSLDSSVTLVVTTDLLVVTLDVADFLEAVTLEAADFLEAVTLAVADLLDTALAEVVTLADEAVALVDDVVALVADEVALMDDVAPVAAVVAVAVTAVAAVTEDETDPDLTLIEDLESLFEIADFLEIAELLMLLSLQFSSLLTELLLEATDLPAVELERLRELLFFPCFADLSSSTLEDLEDFFSTLFFLLPPDTGL